MMNNILFLDFETFSKANIEIAGAHAYTQHPSFEILLAGYAFNDEEPIVVDYASGEKTPKRLQRAYEDPNTLIVAHNAAFERLCLQAAGIDIPVERFYCTAIKAGFCGLPQKLATLSQALNLQEGKLETGNALIKLFTVLQKPTKANGYKTRVYPQDAPKEWQQFKEYNKYDVLAEREAYYLLEPYIIPKIERKLYILDQKINDAGIRVDKGIAAGAIKIGNTAKENLLQQAYSVTNIDNFNSVPQLKKWLADEMGENITSLNGKTHMPALLEKAAGTLSEQVLKVRQSISKNSISKYGVMLYGTCDDDKIRGMLQMYGATRTARWAGRRLQPQNMPRIFLEDLDYIRELIRSGNYEMVYLLYGDVLDVLAQMIRTALIADEGSELLVADFSAIEARVLAWLAGEDWKLEVFNTHGKIYEATAARMYGIPIEDVDKDQRFSGKTAELALGYQGSLPALERMSKSLGVNMEESLMRRIVKLWRGACPNTVQMWNVLNEAAVRCVKYGKTVALPEYQNITFSRNSEFMNITLPSKRKLYYHKPQIGEGRFNNECVEYFGMIENKKYGKIQTYGGKLCENITQAVARDLIANSMLNLDANGFDLRLHVHDEAVANRVLTDKKHTLERMIDIMVERPEWALDLPVKAAGYASTYYKKD